MNDERYFLSICAAPEDGNSFIKINSNFCDKKSPFCYNFYVDLLMLHRSFNLLQSKYMNFKVKFNTLLCVFVKRIMCKLFSCHAVQGEFYLLID